MARLHLIEKITVDIAVDQIKTPDRGICRANLDLISQEMQPGVKHTRYEIWRVRNK